MGRPDLSFAFTKIALWRQTQFRKIVYLDADVVALRALDELFDIDAPFAAAPDIGWPDAFNSGVMVISPDMGEYWALQTMAATGDSFDGADQGLLNQYFEHRPWQRLKFTYNCTPNAEYQWEPAYRYYKRDISAVHFIGKDKPWSSTRTSAPGVYGELLSRWWQVHNRHLRKEAAPDTTQQQVQGGAHNTESPAPIPAAVETPVTTTEPPMTEPGEAAENIDQGVTEPTPTVQQRKFSAPEMEWDATRFEPPTQSKPEAANFPTAQYTFSDSRQLFKAPQAYPEPPKDMWYKVPENRPKSAEKPKPIFPWEQQPDRPRATRVFAEDLSPEPIPAVSSPTHPFSTVHYDDGEGEALEGLDEGVTSHASASSLKSADKQWQAFQQSNVNAWDSVPGIENYVRAIMDTHGRRTKPQTLQQTTGTEELGSPLLERRNRRESLLLTDFPSAIERPSLPVTPAPMRRPSFWGEERGDTGELPAAEGVPDQIDWVCPQCGFSSVNASSFQRRHESLASTTTAVVSPVVSTASLTLSDTALFRGESSHEVQAKALPQEAPRPAIASLPRDVSMGTIEASVPMIPPPRNGLSPHGVPLASLTDPSLFSPQRQFPGLAASTPIAKASRMP